MKINHHIIRGYDIRGIQDEDLSPQIAEAFGKAYGTYMKRQDPNIEMVVVGYDSRCTSVEYSDAFIKGVTETGLNAINIGLVMVGMVYWAQYHFKTKAATMITASHNPAEYNGFKCAVDYSESMIGEQLESLVALVEKEDFDISDQAGSVKRQDINDIYYDDIIGRFNVTKKFKVVVDASCATAGAIMPDMLRKAGCEVVESNCNIDCTFPLGVADPTEVIVAQRLADKVVETGADIGFAYDADGDRLGVVDEKGGIIWNDVLVAIFAIDVLKHYPGEKIMYNTLCSRVVQETIKAHGGEPFMWRTGHGFLKKKNQEIKAPFIGELSGHFFFSADFYNHDDGAYASLRILDYLTQSRTKLSEEVIALPKYISSPEIKVQCADDKKVALMEKIAPILKKDYPQAEVIDDQRAGDGVRLDMDGAMFVIRYSQNGPYITIKFEAMEQEKYDELRNYINDLLHTFEEIDWNSDIRVNVESLTE